jgi:uncharacterized protein (DUF4415 family)
MDEQNSKLAPEFDREAAPPPERVTVTLEMDADLLTWLKGQPRDWQTEINTTMRFFMETSNTPPVPPPYPDSEADYIPDFDP